MKSIPKCIVHFSSLSIIADNQRDFAIEDHKDNVRISRQRYSHFPKRIKKQPILSINMLLKVDDAAVIQVDKAGNVGNNAFLILAGQHQGESSPFQNILLDPGISSFT